MTRSSPLARSGSGRARQDLRHQPWHGQRGRDHQCSRERQHARVRRVRAAGPARARRLPLRAATGVRLSARVRRLDPVRHRLGRGVPARPPPPLTSWIYAISVNETKAFGQLSSRFRSHDQTNLAAWWLEFNEIQWGRIMRQLTDTRHLGLLDAVRMFALANMANIDATVAVWYAKNYYDFWRPFHAIRLADTDGNPLTEADPNWVSEHIVPPLQEYPSAHAIQCQAIARTLRSIFGTDHVSFSTQSTTALPSNPIRSFNRLRPRPGSAGSRGSWPGSTTASR